MSIGLTELAPAHLTPPFFDRKRMLVVGAIVSFLLIAYFLGVFRILTWDAVKSNLDEWIETTQSHLLLSLVIYIGVYLLVVAFSLPFAGPLTILAGALFGRWMATAAVSFASTTGACLACLMARYLFRDLGQRLLGQRREVIEQGIARDGPFYLFALRLAPVVPFFAVNLGAGLTRIPIRTFAWVSWLGMLPGTFLYVNAGRSLALIDEPSDLVSPSILIALAALGIAPLLFRWLIRRHTTRREVLSFVGVVMVGIVLAAGLRIFLRYSTAEAMPISIREYSNAEYPEDPANRSIHHGKYNGRSLLLTKKDETHFDFEFVPKSDHVATIAFRNIDVGLMTPALPEWTRADDGLRRIALTDRQWNRQQVRFEAKDVQVSGGDGFEKSRLFTAELAKNCLNAGLWEVLLFVQEGGEKALYYQGWFTFPLGHYKSIFERNTGLDYARHAYYLEHWFDPVGTHVSHDGLRTIVRERALPTTFDKDEEVISFGEQTRKRRTLMAENVVHWGDFFSGTQPIRFASFIPPGRYSVAHPWKNQFRRKARFEDAVLRDVSCPGSTKTLNEIELRFSNPRQPGICRLIIGGFDAQALPALEIKDYPKGLYRPMGIGVPPFFQTYGELLKNPPQLDPFYCNIVDENERWIDHHSFGIDGPVMHRDAQNPDIVHLYLLSYERHSLIGHWVLHWPR